MKGGQFTWSAAPRPRGSAAKLRCRASADATRPADRLLELQRQAGNQAVLPLTTRGSAGGGSLQRRSMQRDGETRRESPPVTTLHPMGTLSEQEWTAAYRAAVAQPSVEAFRPLFRDIALTAGMAGLGPGFVPAIVPVSDGVTATPGLNMMLAASGEPGHTGWVDQSGAFGVPLDVDRAASGTAVAIILSPQALSSDKGLSLRSVRHEMVHARHKIQVLAAVEAWRSTPARGRPSFQAWLTQQARKKVKPMSALDVAFIGRAAKNGSADTEVLAYVEGFATDFHRRPPTAAQAGPAFFELLGAVETRKLYTWAQANPAVQVEALAQLEVYHATLDSDHQRLWKEWLDGQLARAHKDKTGRKDFLTRLAAFVT